MSDLIDRQALMKELEREVDLADDWKTAHEIANVVKYFPPADVPEKNVGKWIKEYKDVYKCTQCHNYLDFSGINGGRGSVNFCPNCGAKMEAEDGRPD